MKRIIACSLTAAILCLGCQPKIAKEEKLPRINFGAKFVLENGLTVIIKEARKQPIVSIAAYLKQGSADEGRFAGSGISHFIEHMLFKGTAARPVGEIEKEIRSYGGTFDGYTSFDYAGYEITALSEFFGNSLEIMADVLQNSTFDPVEFTKERQVILNEIRMNHDDPDRYFSKLLWQKLFTKHTYGYPVIGYEELFEKLTREDLLEYYKENYIPNNIVLAVVGDIDTEEAIPKIRQTFSNFEMGFKHLAEPPAEPLQIYKKEFSEGRPIKLARAAVCFRGTDIKNPDLYAADCLAAILGQKELSRLNSLLKNKLQLVYEIEAYNFTPKYPGAFIIKAVLDEKNLEKVKALIFEEASKLKTEDVSSQELSRAKKIITNQYLLDFETIQSQATLLASNEATTGDHEFLNHYLKKINRVNKKDIKRVAQKYLNEDNLTIISLLPQKKVDKEIKGLSLTPREIPMKKSTLPNGLRVILGQNHDLQIVGISAAFLGGVRAENEQNNGIFNLISRLLLKGTSTKSAEEIANSIESIGGKISNFSANNSFGITIEVLSRDLDIALGLLKDILLDSQFPNPEIKKQKIIVSAQIDAQEEDIFNTGFKLTRQSLFLKHPYRFDSLGTKDSIKKIKRSEIVDIFEDYCSANNMVLSVFGDIDAKVVEKRIAHLLKDFRKNPELLINPAQEPTQDKSRTKTESLQKEQSVIMLGFHGPRISDKKRYSFDILNTMLSGQAGRIFRKIREEQGLSYALGSFPVFGPDPGFLIIYVATTSENIPRVKDILLEELALLGKGSISEEEIELAKKQLIGNHKFGLQSNLSLSFQTSLDELYGLGYENYLNYTNDINVLTKQDIIECADKYFDLTAYSLVIVSPQSTVDSP